ncbi:MAG: hypothetical protein H0T50_10425 [Gemmatimonadales bacterium]|nr:hypothetical protein [Gemmatimonadales bacterium]
MIVVEQPLPGGAHVQLLVGGVGQPEAGVLQDAPGPVEAVEQRGLPAGALAPVEPLLRGESVGPFGQVLRAQQLAPDRPGEQVLAGVGTAGDETGGQSGCYERSDGVDLTWMTDAV